MAKGKQVKEVRELKSEPQPQEAPKQPEGIWISNEAWSKLMGELSVFKPSLIEFVVKAINSVGEVK